MKEKSRIQFSNHSWKILWFAYAFLYDRYSKINLSTRWKIILYNVYFCVKIIDAFQKQKIHFYNFLFLFWLLYLERFIHHTTQRDSRNKYISPGCFCVDQWSWFATWKRYTRYIRVNRNEWWQWVFVRWSRSRNRYKTL